MWASRWGLVQGSEARRASCLTPTVLVREAGKVGVGMARRVAGAAERVAGWARRVAGVAERVAAAVTRGVGVARPGAGASQGAVTVLETVAAATARLRSILTWPAGRLLPKGTCRKARSLLASSPPGHSLPRPSRCPCKHRREAEVLHAGVACKQAAGGGRSGAGPSGSMGWCVCCSRNTPSRPADQLLRTTQYRSARL